MATCRSLQHIFEKPLPESPTLLGSLSSWNQIKSTNPINEDPSFTEIFGELHFKDNPPESFPSSNLPISSSSSPTYLNLDNNNEGSTNNPPSDYCYHKSSDSFSSMNSESLQLCTEGLGFESSDDVEDLSNDWQSQEERISITKYNTPHDNPGSDFRRSRISGRTFPPPISSIGQSGKPWVCFKSYRHNGRFVLKEIRVPTQEFLHACREDGRLKLQLVQSDDETLEEEEDDEEEEEEDGKSQEEQEKEEEEEEEAHNSDNNQDDGDRGN